MKKRITLLTLIALIAFSALAQDHTNHEILISTAGGQSKLSYSHNIGGTKNKAGYDLGINYFYNLNHSWSVGTGLDISTYNTEYNQDMFSDSYMTNDGIQDFEFTTKATNYNEKQTATYLNIPIIGRMIIPVFKNAQFYTSAGVKIGIPISKKYEVSKVLLENYGHYFEPENVIYDSQKFMGFGSFNYSQGKQSLDLQTAILGTIETGLKFNLNTNLALFTGVYFEQSLNNLKKGSSDKYLIEYNSRNPDNISLNGIFSSQYKIDQQYSDFIINNVHTVSIGLKIGLSIKL